MAYTPSYEKPYADGFKNKPNETTPITADVMNGYDNAIVSIETYLAEGGGGGGSASIEYGDEDAFNEWSETAENGEVFVRTDDNDGTGGDVSTESFSVSFDSTYITHWWSNETTFPNQYKWGKVVSISFVVKLASNINQNTWQTIGTIPSGFRPSASVYFPIKYADSAYGVTGLISSSGSLRLIAHSTALAVNQRLAFTVTYIAS